MKKITTKFLAISLLFQLVNSKNVNAQTTQIFHEGFDTMATMFSNGWEAINKSNPVGTTSWFQGTLTIGAIAYTGDSASYAQVQYTSTADVGTSNTISDWLLTPPIQLQNLDTVSFYCLSYNSATFPDNLECRLSAMGTSNNVGPDEVSVGDFSTLLFEINPTFDLTSFPSVAVAGQTWTKFSGVVSGLTGLTNCRLAIRYYVLNGGLAGANSSSVGVDEFSVMRNTLNGINENTLNVGIQLYPNPTAENITLNFSEKGDYLINVFNTIGQNVLSLTTGSNVKIDVSKLPSSLYNVRIADKKTGNFKTISFVME